MRCYCVSGVVLAAAVAFAGYGGAAAASQGGSVMSNSAASPPTAAPLSSATPESPRAIPLGELSSADVVSLLHSWSLDRAFAAGFQEQQFDGLILESLLELDVSSPLALADLQKQFPNTSLLQWIKLKKLVRRVVDDAGGMVDAATLLHSSSSSVASGGGASSESREPRADEASDQRRELAGSSPSLGDGYGGVLVKRSKAIVALGPQGDVAFRRVGNESSLLIEADTVEFTSDHIAFSATEAFVANGTDLVQCCRDNQEAFNLTATEIKFLLAEAQDMRTDIRILKQEMVYLEERLNATCTAADEGAYSCYNVADDFSTCVESIETLELAWYGQLHALMHFANCSFEKHIVAEFGVCYLLQSCWLPLCQDGSNVSV